MTVSWPGSPARDGLYGLGLFVLLSAALLFIVWDMRPYPLVTSVDDYLYVRMAYHLRKLQWLGPFEATTLVKRPLVSAFIATTSLLHLPFIQAQMFLFGATALALAAALRRVGRDRIFTAAIGAALFFLPTVYDANGGRVLRETTSTSLELIIFALVFRLTLLPRFAGLGDLWRRRGETRLALLLVLVAVHWGMREEAFLLSLTIAPTLFALSLVIFTGAPSSRALRGLFLAGLVFGAVGAARLCLSAANRAAYGVFIVNDLSEGNFPRLLGAIKAVQEGPAEDLLVGREEAKKISDAAPSFKMIESRLFLDRPGTELDYSHQMIHLRTGVVHGLPFESNAIATQAFFAEVAEDIERACREDRLRCDDQPRFSALPRLSSGQRSRIIGLFARNLRCVIGTTNSGFETMARSRLPGLEEVPGYVMKRYESMTRQRMFGFDGTTIEYEPPAEIAVVKRQVARRRAIGDFYSRATPVLYGAALFLTPLFLFWCIAAPERRTYLIAAGALLAHVILRVGAFAYLGAADGSIAPRLIAPAYPFALIWGLLVLRGGLEGGLELAKASFRHGLAVGMAAAPRN